MHAASGRLVPPAGNLSPTACWWQPPQCPPHQRASALAASINMSSRTRVQRDIVTPRARPSVALVGQGRAALDYEVAGRTALDYTCTQRASAAGCWCPGPGLLQVTLTPLPSPAPTREDIDGVNGAQVPGLAAGQRHIAAGEAISKDGAPLQLCQCSKFRCVKQIGGMAKHCGGWQRLADRVLVY